MSQQSCLIVVITLDSGKKYILNNYLIKNHLINYSANYYSSNSNDSDDGKKKTKKKRYTCKGNQVSSNPSVYVVDSKFPYT